MSIWSTSRVTCAVAVAAVLAASGVTPATAASKPPPGGGLVVQTADGAVRGQAGDGVRTFEGIPYAAPPVGDLRFQPPAPAEAWTGVRDATGFDPQTQCAQLTRLGNLQTFGEDCLYLNVTVPAGKSAKGLPVMVWVHGGSFVYGTGYTYDASKLAAQGDVVVVTINYRLGPLGFLANPALSAERPAAGSGDYALLDQQAALRWVQENARAFGGNPNNVTLFGESAGAASVCANLVSPSAEGLFHRAIVQSFSCAQPYAPLAQAEQAGQAFAARVGCAGAADVGACLRGVPSEQLLRAWTSGAFAVGGQNLPLQPAQAIATDQYNSVKSVMHGNTRDENRLFAPLTYLQSGRAFPTTPAQYDAAVRAQYGANGDAVLAEYPLSDYPSAIVALSTIATDRGSGLSTCEHVKGANLLTDPPQATKTFAYQFRDRTASPLISLIPTALGGNGAAHATELPYLFPGLFGAPLNAEQQQLSDAMVGYWTRFAKTGNPDTGSDLPRWERYRQGSGVVLGLDLASAGGITPVDVAAESNCAFWAKLGLV